MAVLTDLGETPGDMVRILGLLIVDEVTLDAACEGELIIAAHMAVLTGCSAVSTRKPEPRAVVVEYRGLPCRGRVAQLAKVAELPVDVVG